MYMYTHFSVSELVDAVPLVPVPTAALPVFIPPPITFQRNPREKDDILLDTVLLLCNFKMKKKMNRRRQGRELGAQAPAYLWPPST